jgi:hypothetical protein
MSWTGGFDDSEASEGTGGCACPPEGEYLVEIVDTARKHTKKQPPSRYVSVKMKLVEHDYEGWVFDNWMMEGKGAGITKKKSQAFGIELSPDQIREEEWIGRRAIAYLKPEQYGKYTNPKVDIEQLDCGFRPGEGEFDSLPF